MKMNLLCYFCIVFWLSVSSTNGNESVENGNKTYNKYYASEREIQQMHNMDSVEVPDSALMILDRMSLRSLAARKYKKKPSKQQPTEQPPQQQQQQQQQQEEESSPALPSCECDLGICKCCTGHLMELINQKACMKIMYHPGDFAFDVTMALNDRVLYENSLSGKNPRPICVNPPRMPNLKVCAKFYNVFFPGRNFHFCLAMTGQWRATELFNMAFDCLRLGANGLAMVKPDDDGGLPIPSPYGGVNAVVDAGGDEDIEDYDENVVKSLLDIFDDK